MQWISACFVLHNIAVEVEGSSWVERYALEGHGEPAVEHSDEEEDGVEEAHPAGAARRRQLVHDYYLYLQAQN